jgi:(p)ppGpp synthase/HD superfamily hydrolase
VSVSTPDRSDLRARAIRFAVAAYEGATPRPGKGMPHGQAVADALVEAGCSEEAQVIGLLHDVVEDTPVTADDLRGAFPQDIAAGVLALTEDVSIEDYDRRKAALRDRIGAAGPPVIAVSLADKVATLEHALVTGERIGPRTLAHYRATLDLALRANAAPKLCDRLRGLLARVEAGAPDVPAQAE